ncbi:MAG: biotin operon repressor [Candidatus Coproplasma sp.]
MSIKSEILKELDARRGEYLSGESLSQSLGVTRQAVWKAIKKLTQEGYLINSVTNRGYMLDGKCDLLSSAIIADRTGASVYCFDEVSSTNTAAMQKLCLGEECIVVAERQTCGRTKSGESFISPEQKGVYMSVALKCSIPLDRTDFILAECTKKIAGILFDCCGNMPEIRNGNELFIGGKKACGILVEGEVNLSAKTIKSVICGVGVYTALVAPELGYITALEPRNKLICDVYNAVKEVIKQI